jgi:serine/threonine protein kinase
VPAPDAFSLAEGAVFHDQYEVVRRIDSGAMGTVYEVTDRRTKRRRALKVMLARFADNADVTERFRREATITADVVSEHVVETFDAGVDKTSGLPFLVMELLRGEDLGKMVRRGPLPQADVVTLLMQAASALDRMHAAGIIHRDLKPENLFVTRRDDGFPRIKLLDFGIAKVIEKAAPSATTTRNMGTPVYMSPEQVTGAGAVGPPADLYAVGQLAYTMLTGEPYWLEDALAHETVYPLLLKIMEGPVEAASTRALRTRKVALPPAFDAWFSKATAHEPEDRHESAADAILALAAALGVPRPALPSYYSDASLSTATTEAPPELEEAPILLVPPPAPLPKESAPVRRQDEALRTLSPVSTLPDATPLGLALAPKPRRRMGAVIALGAAFFVVGVIGAVMIVRPTRRAPAVGAPTTPSAGDTPAATTATAAPAFAPAEPTAAPDHPSSAASAPPADAPPASASAPSTASATAAAHGTKPPKSWPPRAPATGKAAATSNPRYVDPRRDL